VGLLAARLHDCTPPQTLARGCATVSEIGPGGHVAPMYMWAAPSFGPAPPVAPPWGGKGGKGGWAPAPPPIWGGGGKGASAFTSKDSYVESIPRPEDSEGYSSAGLLIYKKGDNGPEVLLSLERPWNSLANDYDPLAWNLLGGKRKTGPGGEWEAPVTAGRWILEVLGGAAGAPSAVDVEQMCRAGPIVWYPQGRFIMFIHQVDPENEAMQVFLDAPVRFAAAKDAGKYPFGPDEQRVNSKGQPTTRWVKQIEELEWVPAADLIAEEPRKPLTDLCKNICLVEHFRSFLLGGALPESVPVPPPPPEGNSKSSGKGGKKGGDKGYDKGGGKMSKDGGKKGGSSGKGKGGKGKGGDWGKGKSVPYPVFAPMPTMPVNPAMYPQEMQRQMLGEKLYMIVTPLVPSATVAQKVTGMLLELPMPELMPLLGSGDGERAMLRTRVDEALEVLEAEEAAEMAA